MRVSSEVAAAWAIVAALVYRFCYPEIPEPVILLVPAILTSMAVSYWWKFDGFRRFLLALVCLCACVVSWIQGFHLSQPGFLAIKGRVWVQSGLLALATGLLLSLAKAGAIERMQVWLWRLHRLLQRRVGSAAAANKSESDEKANAPRACRLERCK